MSGDDEYLEPKHKWKSMSSLEPSRVIHLPAFSRLSQLHKSDWGLILGDIVYLDRGREMNCLLETPKQLAMRVGLTVGAIHRLMNDGKLSFVQIGTRRRIPPGTWESYIETNTVRPCRDAIKDQSSNFLLSAGASTSFGQNGAAAASAALVRQTAQRLKSSSRNSSNATRKNLGHVIPQKSS